MKNYQAKLICILKWEYIVRNSGSMDGLEDEYPEMMMLEHSCAYCELYLHTEGNGYKSCADCPLKPALDDYNDIHENGCVQEVTNFRKWSKSLNYEYGLEYATRLLKQIKES